jgi:hypothetical protein
VKFVNKNNDRLKDEEKQRLLLSQSQKLLEKLPPSLDKTAKEYGAIVRKRGIKSAAGLIQMMLIYVVADLSQRVLATFAHLLGVAEVSDQAWKKNYKMRALADPSAKRVAATDEAEGRGEGDVTGSSS